MTDPNTMTFPSGYAGSEITLAQMRSKHQARYHPEAWRRIEAVAIASGGLLGLAPIEALCGIGGGARTTAEQRASWERDPNTFARPGNSFHETVTWASGLVGAQAVDWVGRDGRHDEAWKWLRDNAGLYGIKTFWNVNGEPWHSQCVELPNSVSTWKSRGRPDPGTWTFPNQSAPVPDYGLWSLNPNKPEIREGSIGGAVVYAQRVLTDKAGQGLAADGDFGPKTAQAVYNLQVFFGLATPGTADRRINKNEWDVLDALLGVHHTPPVPVTPPDQPQIVLNGLYWVQPGDSPYKVEKKVYGGSGVNWAQHFTVDQFNKANYQIPLPDLVGVTAPVIAGEGAYQTIQRMYPTQNPYAPGRLQRFYDLNGGSGRVLHLGDVVFLDEL